MENQQSVENWPKMDISEGEVKTYFELAKNNIYTQEHTFNLSILLSIIHSIINPASLLLILTIIVTNLLAESSPYPIAMYATELSLVVLVQIIQGVLISKTKLETD